MEPLKVAGVLAAGEVVEPALLIFESPPYREYVDKVIDIESGNRLYVDYPLRINGSLTIEFALAGSRAGYRIYPFPPAIQPAAVPPACLKLILVDIRTRLCSTLYGVEAERRPRL